jgi:hypothetical protein
MRAQTHSHVLPYLFGKRISIEKRIGIGQEVGAGYS